MKTTGNKNWKRLLGLAVALGLPNSLWATPIYTAGHGDIGLGYDAGEFEPHWHLHGGAVVDGVPIGADEEYEPAGLVAQTMAMRSSPLGLAAAIGVADGTQIHVMGSSAYPPNLGFGVEELDPADWSGDITVSLGTVVRPGGTEFALYTTTLGGTEVGDVVFSTVSPAATVFGNSFSMTPGDHVHFQWGFTGQGTYDVELTWSGTHVTDGLTTATESFRVAVVPEPSTLGLLLMATMAGCRSFRRRHG